jgi:hypothetical protein
MDTIVGVILGWLLALLSPVIVEAIKRPRAKRDLERAFFSELLEIKFRMLGSVFQLARATRSVDRLLLQWIVAHSDGHESDSVYTETMTSIKQVLGKPEQEMSIYLKVLGDKAPSSLSLKTYPTPFLDSHIPSLSLFESEFQQKIMDVKSRINMINQEVEQNRMYLQLTFQPISQENHATVSGNLDSSYLFQRNFSKDIVERIEQLMNKHA